MEIFGQPASEILKMLVAAGMGASASLALLRSGINSILNRQFDTIKVRIVNVSSLDPKTGRRTFSRTLINGEKTKFDDYIRGRKARDIMLAAAKRCGRNLVTDRFLRIADKHVELVFGLLSERLRAHWAAGAIARAAGKKTDQLRFKYFITGSDGVGSDKLLFRVTLYTDDALRLIMNHSGSWDFTEADGEVGLELMRAVAKATSEGYLTPDVGERFLVVNEIDVDEA